jgi:ubiquinone/menaquinone biosynthesis C-methylase UbiE
MAELSELSEEKQRARAVWSAGDYPGMSPLIADAGRVAVTAGAVTGDDRVLDVACGDGNATIPAAQTGARVTGLDLTPKLLEAGRTKAADAGVEIEWVEGDAEQLPFEDKSFDVVLSVFGVMFAPDHRQGAAEIARVLLPGGRIALCNWTPEGQVGRFFGLMAGFMPPPPEGFQPPPLWGTEDHVRSLFEGTGVEVEFDRAEVQYEFDSVDAAMELFQSKFGPVIMTRKALEPEGKWEAAQEAMRKSFEEDEAADGSLSYPGEYLVTKGTKRA